MQKCITEDWIDEQLLEYTRSLVRTSSDVWEDSYQVLSKLHGAIDFVENLKAEMDNLPDAVEIKPTEEKRE